MRDHLINFLDTKSNMLERIDTPKSSFISSFMRELQHTLEKWRSFEIFQTLPQRTRFTLTGESGDFLELMSFNRRELFFVPTDVVLREIDEIPPLGYPLRFSHTGNLIIHRGGIPLWEHEIPRFRDLCEIAR